MIRLAVAAVAVMFAVALIGAQLVQATMEGWGF